jgi:hypothetical protein
MNEQQLAIFAEEIGLTRFRGRQQLGQFRGRAGSFAHAESFRKPGSAQ